MSAEYFLKAHVADRDAHNRGPHALPFDTDDEYTAGEAQLLRLVLRLKKRVGPFPRWSDLYAELLASGWSPPPPPAAGNEAAELASAVPAARAAPRRGGPLR